MTTRAGGDHVTSQEKGWTIFVIGPPLLAEGLASVISSEKIALTVCVTSDLSQCKVNSAASSSLLMICGNEPEMAAAVRSRFALAPAQVTSRIVWVMQPNLDGIAIIPAARALGIRVFVSLSDSKRELRAATEAAGRGKPFVSPALATFVARHPSGVAANQSRTPGALWPRALSEREREIAELAALGLTNEQISQRLFLGASTVSTHLSSAFRKLDIQRRGQLNQRLYE